VISKSALALFLSVAASLLSQNTWAILSDDEARRAILELRKSVSASQAAILDLQINLINKNLIMPNYVVKLKVCKNKTMI